MGNIVRPDEESAFIEAVDRFGQAEKTLEKRRAEHMAAIDEHEAARDALLAQYKKLTRKISKPTIPNDANVPFGYPADN